jgi:hypothetical protein
MRNAQQWIDYFEMNAVKLRIDWTIKPSIQAQGRQCIITSLKAWQLGETSDGCQLLSAAMKYSKKVKDPDYVKAIRLFIKEEQKHGNNLGLYLDAIGEKRLKRNWGDSLFRWVRHLFTSMELWTLTVITVENAAQLYYQSIKKSTTCLLLQQICKDILIDEAPHIAFQLERMAMIFNNRSKGLQPFIFQCYRIFYFTVINIVWMAHQKVFKAAGYSWNTYLKVMKHKYNKTLKKLQQSGRYANNPALENI